MISDTQTMSTQNMNTQTFVFCLLFTFKHIGSWKTWMQLQNIAWKMPRLKDLEKGMSKKDVAAEYGVSKNNLAQE